MCGIAGYARSERAGRPLEGTGVLDRMIGALAHRGPDDSGHHVTGSVALGHRRLVVIDPEGGAQPMRDEELGLSVTYNGEIYNYRELNAELEGMGYRSRTRSDTETLLHAYAAWGEDCVRRFNGMFAFVLHDERNQLLFAARDRMGKKPLYYYRDGNGLFAFASEAKALLEHPQVPREMDPEAAVRYLVYEHVPAPHTIYRGIRKLEAAHRLTVDLGSGEVRDDCYWDQAALLETAEGSRSSLDSGSWTPRILEALRQAVVRRLISDVPLGVFLSGGVDSSAVAALMVQALGRGKVSTFTIGFTDPHFDESAAAREVAALLGTRHHEEILDPGAVADALPEVSEFLDEPFADPSILPTYLLARFTRRHVTVALGGDGGDEAFAGYATFQALPAVRYYDRLAPRWLDRGVIRPLAHRLPVRHGYLAADFKIKQFLRGAKAPPGQRLWRWLGAFAPEELAGLISPEVLATIDLESLYDPVLRFHARVAARDPIAQDGYLYAKTYLAEGVLTKVDRATMACSLEARSPFLDVDFVELVNTIPSRLKFRGGRQKWILREALRGLLPDRILNRTKQGFSPPLGPWFRGRLRELVCDTLDERAIREFGFLRPEAVRALLRAHLEGSADHRKPLFALLMLERWRRRWLRPAVGLVATGG
jgi:asparagine synthase (glutamine-hydrolysing)